ncbi:hypothetical protein M3J09_001669 [Ascochyta lentis]
MSSQQTCMIAELMRASAIASRRSELRPLVQHSSTDHERTSLVLGLKHARNLDTRDAHTSPYCIGSLSSGSSQSQVRIIVDVHHLALHISAITRASHPYRKLSLLKLYPWHSRCSLRGPTAYVDAIEPTTTPMP